VSRVEATALRGLAFQSFSLGELTTQDLVARLMWINLQEPTGRAGPCEWTPRLRCYCANGSR